jgi:hypothetical protein
MKSIVVKVLAAVSGSLFSAMAVAGGCCVAGAACCAGLLPCCW